MFFWKIQLAILNSNISVNQVKQDTANEQNKPKAKKSKETSSTRTSVTIPYIQGVTEKKIQRIFRAHQVAMAVKPYLSLKKLLVHPEDKTDINNTTGCVYKIPCYNCKKVFIIPLRRYLEKIKGCRRPDIFRIRPWARHSRIISGSAWVFLCRCTCITMHSPPHAPTCSCIFAQQRRVWTSCFACFCAYFQHAL